MNIVYTAETHDQVLGLWREQGLTGLRVAHVDFHCDMRGLLIDRVAQRAYRVWDLWPNVDEGNFLTHAILEGRVSSVTWVHDYPGGRRFDVGTVKYSSDLTALPYRLSGRIRANAGTKLEYRVVPNAWWQGPRADEFLDIDWDFFAALEFERETIGRRVERFLDRTFVETPSRVAVAYSPRYCHSSREAFRDFTSELSRRFGAELVELAEPPTGRAQLRPHRSHLPKPVFRLVRNLRFRAGLWLHGRGIY